MQEVNNETVFRKRTEEERGTKEERNRHIIFCVEDLPKEDRRKEGKIARKEERREKEERNRERKTERKTERKK